MSFNSSCFKIIKLGKYVIRNYNLSTSTVYFQLAEMNGKMVVSKPLYVALAQRKEERRARLQVWSTGSVPKLRLNFVVFFLFILMFVFNF